MTESQVDKSGWFRSVFAIALLAAILGALGEYALIVLARVALGRYIMLNPQGVWLAPLANVCIFLVPVAVGWMVARTRGVGFAGAVSVGVFLAVLEPLLLVRERVHPVALVAFAAGVATVTARWMGSGQRSGWVSKQVTRMSTALALLLAAAALGFNGWRRWRERQWVQQLPAAAADAPNVILLVWDTVRALSLSTYGYGRPTSPFLSELAARGSRFDLALATAPWTLPTHATLMTGRFPHELSASWSVPLDGAYPTLAEQLTKLGYATGGVAANLHYVGYEFGISRGFGFFRDFDVSIDEALRSSSLARAIGQTIGSKFVPEYGPGRQSAPRVLSRFLRWQEGVKGRPFFALLNLYDAHSPYAPPAPYDTMFLGRTPKFRTTNSELAPGDERELQAAYDASIAYLDAELRRFVQELERRGVLGKTLLIVTSDHGEEFMEHGLVEHGNSLYLTSIHVPLVVVQPGRIPAGVVVREPVTLRDVAATILRQVGASKDMMLPGQSLSRFWGDSAVWKEPQSLLLSEVDYAPNLPAHYPVSKGEMKAILVDSLRYILGGDGRGEMFSYRADPAEQNNLIGDSLFAERARQLRLYAHAVPKHSVRETPKKR